MERPGDVPTRYLDFLQIVPEFFHGKGKAYSRIPLNLANGCQQNLFNLVVQSHSGLDRCRPGYYSGMLARIEGLLRILLDR